MSSATVTIHLLGGFDCDHAGDRVDLPLGARRLLALLALRESGTHRGGAAARLWPDCPVRRAGGNLRSALWQARRVAHEPVVECVGPKLRLSPTVLVDRHDVQRRAVDALDRPTRLTGPECDRLVAELGRELLPEWNEDWLVIERQRWDQARLHALEALAEALLAAKRYAVAMQTAIAAIAVEPVRESAQRTVVALHLAEGNVASALLHYQSYRSLLRRELGVAPSPQLARMVTPLQA